jgi:Ca-activated chloride channel homolog
VTLAAFTLPVQAPRAAVSVRVLLDCSGSMAGSSIASTRRAVRSLLRALGPQDVVSLTCFGSHWTHLLEPGLSSPTHLGQAREALRQVDADMGSMEMAGALQAVLTAWPGMRGPSPGRLTVLAGPETVDKLR